MVIVGSMVIESSRVEWCMSWWRTLRGRDTAARHLDRLAVAAERRGQRGVKLYPDRSSAVPFPMLLFSVWGPKEDVGVLAMARAIPGGGWAYFDVFAEPWLPFAPCRDAVMAADQVAALLHHRMYPDTFPAVS